MDQTTDVESPFFGKLLNSTFMRFLFCNNVLCVVILVWSVDENMQFIHSLKICLIVLTTITDGAYSLLQKQPNVRNEQSLKLYIVNHNIITVQFMRRERQCHFLQ